MGLSIFEIGVEREKNMNFFKKEIWKGEFLRDTIFDKIAQHLKLLGF